MQVRLLGPVDVVDEGRAKPVSGLRRRAVLAMLGLNAGRPVSTEHLIDVVWDGQPPSNALNTLQSHISYLRGMLGGRGAIVARPTGAPSACSGHPRRHRPLGGTRGRVAREAGQGTG